MSPDKPRKLFILDTNVLLYDHTAVYSFQEHDVVIPIVVLEEIDDFKKGNDLINFEAREFIRELDRLCPPEMPEEGIPLGEGRGRLSIQMGEARSDRVDAAFTRSKPDNRIIALADQLRAARPDRQVIIVSKDVALRMKAKSLGLLAQDYETGKVSDLERLYTGTERHEHMDVALIDRFYHEPYAVPVGDVEVIGRPVPHQYFVLRNGSSSVLARYEPAGDLVQRVFKNTAYGIEPRNAEQTFALDALLRPEIKLVTLTGKAGTGKTLLALAAALKQVQRYPQIFLARPVVPLGNRDIGYLPGDVSAKLDPYMQPLHDNLGVIRHRFDPRDEAARTIDRLAQEGRLVIAPLAYIRGRSLDNIFFIVDEAQNLTPHEVKTIITRAGRETKIVFTGDIHQIDTPYLDSRSNGLAFLVDRMKGQDIFAHVNLVKGERSPLAELASNLL
jgi:PhoH-like ATPase